MKKSIITLLFLSSLQVSAISSNVTHRVMGTSPLLYKMIDYSKHKVSFEAEPIYMSMYENQQVVSNMILGGKKTLTFDQQGSGDFNPMWINLMSINQDANYNSEVTFNPSLTQSGVLLHWYNNFENMFIDVRTALVQSKTEVTLTEVGGGNGLIPGILNAQQAFSQADWNYGKIGQANHVVGLDNIELRIGGVTKATSNASTYNLFITGFGIIEAPTGTGTKSEWLFEPQVGTNHWGLGLGFEALVCGDDDLRFMIAGNYRYLIPAWETRSFDLLYNGQWSRYLGVQDTYGLPTAPTTLALPGINFFTQQAYIKGRSELNLYTRLSKQMRSSLFELSYNFFCLQQESIGTIKNPTPGYGIYALTGPAGGAGGVTTASKATINQDLTNFDQIGSPVAITVDDFNKASACQGTYAANTIAARLEIMHNNIVYGFGAAIEAGLSNNAISTWSVWAKFEYQFDNTQTSENHAQQTSSMYNIDPINGTIEYHDMHMDQAHFPQDAIDHTVNTFIENLDSFEFIEEDAQPVTEQNTIDSDEIIESTLIQTPIKSEIIEDFNTTVHNDTDEQHTDNNELANNTIESDATNEDVLTEEILAQEPIITEDTFIFEDDHEILPIADHGFEIKQAITNSIQEEKNNDEQVMSEEEILETLDSTK